MAPSCALLALAGLLSTCCSTLVLASNPAPAALESLAAEFRDSLDPSTPSNASIVANATLDDGGQEEPRWACDVQAWVRAPDLVAGEVSPGEVRLKANGTACEDVVGARVGLRFKERAIVRVRKEDVDAPERPVRNVTDTGFDDYNDVFRMDGFGYWPRDPYQTEMETYALAMKNASLWEVSGREREVFDVKLDLRSSDRLRPTVIENPSVNNIWPFRISVPYVAYPAMTGNRGSWSSSGDMEGMSKTESLLEYYVELALKNGTTLERPAGRTAFLPGASRHPSSSQSLAFTGLRDLGLEAARRPSKDLYDEDDCVPACEEGLSTSFRVHVDSPASVFLVQGQNISLPVSVSRSGNGSEIATRIQLKLGSVRDHTWARSSTTKAQFESLRSERNRHVSFGGNERSMLMVQPAADMRAEAEAESSYRWRSREARWINVEPPRDGALSQRVMANLQLPWDIMPDTNMTFSHLGSLLFASITTDFLCDADKRRADKATSSGSDDDDNWQGYRPPRESREDDVWYRPSHSGNASVVVLPSLRSKFAHDPIPYTSPEALSPVLFHVDVDPSTVQHTPVGTLLREETAVDELKRSRYGVGTRYPELFRRNEFRVVGGAHEHAASLWQGKEERERETLAQKAKEDGLAASSSAPLVIQT